MSITIIALLDRGDAIGLPCDSLSVHTELLKGKCMGHTAVWGRTTWQLTNPLNRPSECQHIVMSRNPKLQGCTDEVRGAYVVSSVDAILKIAESDEVFIVGCGAELYNVFMPHATRMLITRVTPGEFPSGKKPGATDDDDVIPPFKLSKVDWLLDRSLFACKKDPEKHITAMFHTYAR